jgi:hypothetical protein
MRLAICIEGDSAFASREGKISSPRDRENTTDFRRENIVVSRELEVYQRGRQWN